MKTIANSFFIVGITLFLYGCSQVKNFQVVHLNNSGARQTGSMIYALPQTAITLVVQARKTEITPGPYHKFAHKYLGVEEAIQREVTTWEITGVSVSTRLEVDPDYVYSLAGPELPASVPLLEKFLNDSLLLEARQFATQSILHYPINLREIRPEYTDLSVKRNFESDKGVEVSLLMPDTLYSTRPATRNALKEKTLEQKAEEAANFLIKLRKRRFKLVAGQYEFMPDGTAMRDALTELSRLEQEYLSLFIGKQASFQVTRTFSVVPQSGKDSERILLFRFSDKEGFASPNDAVGKPVMIELTPQNKTQILALVQQAGKLQANRLVYRVPDQASFRVLYGEVPLSEGTMQVLQYGEIIAAEATMSEKK